MRARLVALISLCCALAGCDPNVLIGYAPDGGARSEPDAGGSAGAGGRTAGASGGAGSAGMQAAAAGMAGSAGALADAGVDAGVDAGPLSEVSWISGSHPGSELQSYLDWGTWRGRDVTLAQVYSDRRTWAGVTEPGWLLEIFRSFPGQISMSQPLFPEGGLGNLEECAAGMYEDEWERFGTFLVDNDRADMIIRLGWGFNDPVKEWRVGEDPQPWIDCFQSIVDAIRRTDPDVQIDWTQNSYASPIPASGNPYDAYPGDDYVDYVGMDVYDQNPASLDEAQWEARCNSIHGLCNLMDFAREHGKKVSVGEWGVSSCGTDPGGDNPLFVQKMYETFVENTDIMGYEAYFNDTGAGVCSSLLEVAGEVQNPLAAERYQELYGPR